MLNYVYYYWNYEKGMTGITGWDIRAVSSEEELKLCKPLFAYFGGLNYGKNMQEYVFRIRNRWMVFRVFKIASVNRRDDKACAVSWVETEEEGSPVHFPQRELHHEEYAAGVTARPTIEMSEAESLPEKKFWSAFMLYLWQMIILRRNGSCLLTEETESKRKILNLVAAWLPEWMKESFSAVLTESMEEKEAVRLCICNDITQEAAEKKEVILWNCPESVPKVKGMAAEQEESLLQMFSDWYDWYQKDSSQFYDCRKFISALSQEYRNLSSVREHYNEYKMKVMTENLEADTKKRTENLLKLLQEANELSFGLETMDSENTAEHETKDAITEPKELMEYSELADLEELMEYPELIDLEETEEAELWESVNFIDFEERTSDDKDKDTGKSRKNVKEEQESGNYVFSGGLHKFLESHSGFFKGRRKK